jgi:conserved oligomeric Golgi complex subunit 6
VHRAPCDRWHSQPRPLPLPAALQILEIKTESPELVSALQTLSEFYDDNTPAARRALRSTIERRGLTIHEQFLTAAESVIQVLGPSSLHCSADLLTCDCLAHGMLPIT